MIEPFGVVLQSSTTAHRTLPPTIHKLDLEFCVETKCTTLVNDICIFYYKHFTL